MIPFSFPAPIQSARARVVHTVALAPAPGTARAARINVSGPARPETGPPLPETGQAMIATARESMEQILARALGRKTGETGGLNALATEARRSGRYGLARSAETFMRLSAAFDGTAAALAAPETAGSDRDGLVRRAIVDIAQARVEPDRLRRDIASLRTVYLMKLTGASGQQQERALAFRRAVDAAAIADQRRGIVDTLTRDWQSGALSVAITRTEVGAGQSWTLDRSGARGTQTVLVDPVGFGALTPFAPLAMTLATL